MAVSVHLDRYLVERDFKNAGVLPVGWVLRPHVVAIDVVDTCALTASGVPHMVARCLYLQRLKVEDASVVTPFFQAAPLFGDVLSYRVLGERLTFAQDFGGRLIGAGRETGPALKWRLVMLVHVRCRCP